MPDMRLPIQYAFSYPQRLKASFPVGFQDVTNLTFEQPDTTVSVIWLWHEALHKRRKYALYRECSQ